MNKETQKKQAKKQAEIEAAVEEIQAEMEQVEEQEAEDIAEVNEEVDKLKEEIMRMRAEMENNRKRNARELENLRKYSIDKFAKALLPVADSMDKELEAHAKNEVEMTVDQMAEGTILTQNVLLKVLNDNGVEIINPEGEKFNPEFHEAMAQIPNPDLKPNTIVDVFQKGYLLNGRLIRPAMVVVSK